MSSWVVKRTDSFLKYLKKHKSHQELLRELGKKIERLKENPEILGGFLSGRLHGTRATRLTGKYRLVFKVDKDNRVVYLLAIDHRGKVYG